MRRVTGVEYGLVRLFMVLHVWWIGVLAYKNPSKSTKAVLALARQIRNTLGAKRYTRAFKVDGKYIFDLYNPGWPSRAFGSFYRCRLHEIQPISPGHSSLRRLIVAITKKCPLQCEHCCEGETLQQANRLTCVELRLKMQAFVKQGVAQLVYTGGEPLSRFEDLITLIRHFRTDTDQWIYTSGFGLTAHKARLLKEAGLNGAAISIDHHVAYHHNVFRGNRHSFSWAVDAVRNCNLAGLVTALNVCPTREYLRSFNFEAYIRMARELNVAIVNIIEPRSVGNYGGQQVELGPAQKDQLMRICAKYSFSDKMAEYPNVVYPAGFGKLFPCGGGRSYLFMDFDGQLYPCPFCKTRTDSGRSDKWECSTESIPASKRAETTRLVPGLHLHPNDKDGISCAYADEGRALPVRTEAGHGGHHTF